MTNEQLVGRKFRHKKRGSEYVVLTEILNHREDFEDGQDAYLWCLYDSCCYERYFLVSSTKPDLDEEILILMRLPFTMQVSGEHKTHDGIVIYQCLSDHKIWGRFKSEFQDGRFEEVE